MKFTELSFEGRNEVTELFAIWLKPYTQEVINKVIAKRDEIISNDMTMNMLRELKARQEKENKDFYFSIQSLLENYDTFKEFDSHNHPTTHSQSYRDVLRDMYF